MCLQLFPTSTKNIFACQHHRQSARVEHADVVDSTLSRAYFVKESRPPTLARAKRGARQRTTPRICMTCVRPPTPSSDQQVNSRTPTANQLLSGTELSPPSPCFFPLPPLTRAPATSPRRDRRKLQVALACVCLQLRPQNCVTWNNPSLACLPNAMPATAIPQKMKYNTCSL